MRRRKRAVRTIPADHEFVPRGNFIARNHGRPFVGSKFGAASPGRKLSAEEIARVASDLRDRGILQP
jgi:hypothetical protein